MVGPHAAKIYVGIQVEGVEADRDDRVVTSAQREIRDVEETAVADQGLRSAVECSRDDDEQTGVAIEDADLDGATEAVLAAVEGTEMCD